MNTSYILKLLFLGTIIALIVVLGFVLNTPQRYLHEDRNTTYLASMPISTSENVFPDELLRQYFAYIEKGQFDAMFDMLTSLNQAYISKEDFIERNRNIYEGIGAHNITVTVTDMYVNNPLTAQKIVRFNVSMDTIAGEITYDGYAFFDVTAENEYRLLWSSRMIFPWLEDDYRVRIGMTPARRGSIYDRNGEMLAGPGPASNVGFVPGRMRTEEAYKDSDIAKIAGLLEMTPEGIIRRLNASYVRDDTFVLLRTIPWDAQGLIDELLTVQGIMISSTTVRYYPLGPSAAHLVGYIQNINAEELEALGDEGYHMNSVIGRAGLESIFENHLRARDGREIFIVDSQGNRVITLARKAPVNGQDLRLTIDANIQRQLFYVFETDSSASVAKNPITGEVLALVSTPAYDPNDFVRGMTASVWAGLVEDENLPLFNRFRATFSPGSTMKAITAAIGVESGVIQPNLDIGRSGLSWQLDESWGGYFITTVQAYGNRPANLNNAMAISDNIYFAMATLAMGEEIFTNGLRALGFGERIPFEYGLFSSSVSRTGIIESDILLADSGYGQGEILMNPVHLAAIYAAFVNDGSMIEPWLIYDRPNPSQLWIPNAFTPATARVVLESLIYTIEHGTGQPARVPGTTLAGKTGTAEIKLAQGDRTGREIGWFVLFTADENTANPLLVVSMVEDVQGRGGSGYVVPRVASLFN